MKTIIHVNQHVLRKNTKEGTSEPVLTVRSGKRTVRAHRVYILGPSEVIYRPHRPLGCGARCWIETHSEVTVQIGTIGDK